jgi:PBP1b-binding outer membrane lipoprotein LpoB
VQFTPPTALSYTVVAGSGATVNTGSGVNDVKITALSADVAKLEIGQRIRLADVSGAAYTNDSIAVKSKVNETTFTIDTNYTTTVAASSLREHFHETSASTTLNFLNRGVLPDVPTTAINVTLSTEPS